MGKEESKVEKIEESENLNGEEINEVIEETNNEEIEKEQTINKIDNSEVKTKKFFQKWWFWVSTIICIVIVITAIIVVTILNKAPLSVSENSLNNTREELLDVLNNNFSKKSVKVDAFQEVKGNKVAEQCGLKLYETTLNQDTVIQCIEKDGKIQAIRSYAFIDEKEKFSYKYDQSIRSYAYLQDDLSVAYKNVAFVIGIITREIGTPEEERDRVTNLIASDIEKKGVTSDKFFVKLQEVDYYTTGLIIFDLSKVNTLNVINSETTTNKLNELKQDSIIEEIEESIKRVDDSVKKESVSVGNLKSGKSVLESIKKQFDEMITDYDSENEYNDYSSEYPRIMDKKENWYKQIDEIIGYIDGKMKVTVPDFDTMTSIEAEKWGKDNDITVKTSTDYSSSVANNKKISQSVNAGEVATKGETSINVVYSLGRKPTREDINALEKAKSYAKNLHMSKKGIYDQLTSSYGEDFSEEAAQYAIDHLSVDYKANALEKAKSYRDNLHMSKNSIYSQLISSYGEDFTKEEAQYAIDHLDD